MHDNAGMSGEEGKHNENIIVPQIEGGDAASAVFAVPELLAMIITNLPADSLLSCMRICSTFHQSIARSQLAQHNLFRDLGATDDSYDTARRFNHLLVRTNNERKDPMNVVVIKSGDTYWRFKKPEAEIAPKPGSNPHVCWREWWWDLEDEDEATVPNKPSSVSLLLKVEVFTNSAMKWFEINKRKVVRYGSYMDMYFCDPPMPMNVLVYKLIRYPSRGSDFAGELICKEGVTVGQLLEVMGMWNSGAQAPAGFEW